MINSSNVTTFYVSQQYGHNLNSGFHPENTDDMQGPLQSIEAALNRIKNLRRCGACQPIDIVIIDDVYFVEQPIRIPNEVCLVRFRGLNNTVISGGKRVTGFKKDVFNGVDCFSAAVPDGLSFTDFYVDGLRADIPHLPQNGHFLAESVEHNSLEIGGSSKWFIAKPEDIALFKTLKDFGSSIISFNHYWVDEHTPIEDFDFTSGKITFRYLSRFSIGDPQEESRLRYRLDYVPEAFTNKNEWYLDKEAAKVYYIPREDSQTPENIEAYIPVAEQLFTVSGTPSRQVENISFEGLTFAHTRGDYVSHWAGKDSIGTGDGRDYLADEEIIYASDDQSVQKAPGALSFQYARGCALEFCTFRNLGLYALEVGNGCCNTRIYGNKFYDIGAGGIKMGGAAYGCEKEEETFGNIISQNSITYCGRRYDAGCGILMKHTYGNIVSHNEIHHIRYTGISLGWVWGYADNISRDNILEKNHIYHIGYSGLSDMGGIYALGIQPGTIIRGNVIHDVQCSYYGGHCLYTDEGCSNMLIENNICYNATSSAFNQHYGCMNTVRNNIFVKSKDWPVRSCRSEMHPCMIMENNIIVCEGTAIYGLGYGKGYTGNFQKVLGKKNLVYNPSGDVKIFSLANRDFDLNEVQTVYGLEHGSVEADPLFADYENNDFTLADNSPAYALGFRKINTDDVGVTIQL